MIKLEINKPKSKRVNIFNYHQACFHTGVYKKVDLNGDDIKPEIYLIVLATNPTTALIGTNDGAMGLFDLFSVDMLRSFYVKTDLTTKIVLE